MKNLLGLAAGVLLALAVWLFCLCSLWSAATEEALEESGLDPVPVADWHW
jgi:hypothetical protein